MHLGSLSNLFYFNAGNNKLAGTIPDFSSFSKLQYLLLHGNNFEQDSFPKWIFQMSNLIELYLDSSYMPGPIFPGISKLVGLQVLSLSYCNVTGNITLDIQYLKNLQTLYLDHNQLTGPIPQEISLIADLSYLDLSNNELDPTVPLAIKQMKNYDPNNFLFANQSVPPVSTGVPPVSAGGGSGSMYIIIAVVVVVILGIAGAGFYLYSLKMKKTKSNAQKDSYNQGQPQIVNQPQSPPFNQVQPQPFIQTPPQMFAQQQPPELNRGTAFDQPYSTPQGHPNQYIQSAQYHPAQMQVYSNGQVEQTLQQQYPNAQFLGAQDSPLTEKYSPQRHSPGSSPEQTLVVTNTSYQSVNLNSPYSNHQSLSTSKAELPVLSAVQSPFADLLLQPDHLQPPVLARNDSNGPVSKKEEIEIDSQPPLLF
ncbi:hypothetical protein HK103_005916 [Boothiomyces macroporosus]|uniref:Uncharacterized protein n=1 Tax=Boothiomyces macroporosus TaxID=261099 RepID=A0AAD5UQQ8_9FUNG|nr:hypothetical protein HK103_005916 [Boothiomyces macroporosus]